MFSPPSYSISHKGSDREDSFCTAYTHGDGGSDFEIENPVVETDDPEAKKSYAPRGSIAARASYASSDASKSRSESNVEMRQSGNAL